MPPTTVPPEPAQDSSGRPGWPGAIALSHADKSRPPLVVAKGYGAVAEAIVRRARESGLYVHESPELVRLLMQLSLDDEIPPQLYQAVAEILVWLHGLEGLHSPRDSA